MTKSLLKGQRMNKRLALTITVVISLLFLSFGLVIAESYYNINNVLVLTDNVASPSDNLFRSWNYSQNTSFDLMKSHFRFWEFYTNPSGVGYRCVQRDVVKCRSCTGTFWNPARLPNVLLPPPPPGGSRNTWRTAQHKSRRYSTSSTVTNYTSVNGTDSTADDFGNNWIDFYGQCPNFEG